MTSACIATKVTLVCCERNTLFLKGVSNFSCIALHKINPKLPPNLSHVITFAPVLRITSTEGYLVIIQGTQKTN